MREILFRGKNSNGDWIFGNLLRFDGEVCIIQNYPEFKDLPKYRVRSSTVCQYTGLTDKNGRKIFENDIVGIYSDYRGEWDYGIVKYGAFNCPCCYSVYGWYFDGGDIRDCVLYEVKGNIIDNRGLLKE